MPSDGFFDGSGNWIAEDDPWLEVERSLRKVQNWTRQSQREHRDDHDHALAELLEVPFSELHPERTEK